MNIEIPTLRTGVPTLLCMLMESGVAVTLNPSKLENVIDIEWHSVWADVVESETSLRGTDQVPFEIDVYGANSILLEKALRKILKQVIKHQVETVGDSNEMA